MRLLIICYSVYGTNKKICEELKQDLACDLEELVDQKPRQGFWNFVLAGRDALLKKTTAIQPIKSNLDLYDVVLLGTPIWVGSLPPATRTFLRQYKDKIKRLAVLSVSGNGAGNQNAPVELASESGKQIELKLLLSEKEFKKGLYRKQFEEFVKSLRTLRNVKGDLQR